MFGYVRPLKSELLVREFEEYKGIYCSLCRQLGRSYGPQARLALNYDCTFYALMLLSLSSVECGGFRQGRCVVNPFKRCLYRRGGTPEFRQAAALTILLLYYKLKDDIADTAGPKKLWYVFLYPAVACMHARAGKEYPRLDRIVFSCMDKQQKVEHLKDPALDLCAEPTASMMEQILEFSVSGFEQIEPSQVRILKQVGYFLGKWIYLMDAADDLAKDTDTGSFNPFAIKFRLEKGYSEETMNNVRDYANQTLNMTLSQLSAACNLLELNGTGPIVHNIVEKGLSGMQKKLLFMKENAHV